MKKFIVGEIGGTKPDDIHVQNGCCCFGPDELELVKEEKYPKMYMNDGTTISYDPAPEGTIA